MTKTERFLRENANYYMKEGHALLVSEMNGDFPKTGASGDPFAIMMCLASMVKQISKQTNHTWKETLEVIEEMLIEVENE